MARKASLATRPLVFGLVFIATTGTAAPAEVRVRSQVAQIATATGPHVITLKPGEHRLVPVKVAANFPWKLVTNSGNPAISVVPINLQGSPGGFLAPGNSVAVEVKCEPSADSDQTTTLSYSLDRR